MLGPPIVRYRDGGSRRPPSRAARCRRDVGPARRPLGALFLARRADQRRAARGGARRKGRRTVAGSGRSSVSRGWVDPTALASVLAEQHGLEFVDLNGATVDRGVAALLPEQYARRYQALPVRLGLGRAGARRGRRSDERRRLRRPAARARAERAPRGRLERPPSPARSELLPQAIDISRTPVRTAPWRTRSG